MGAKYLATELSGGYRLELRQSSSSEDDESSLVTAFEGRVFQGPYELVGVLTGQLVHTSENPDGVFLDMDGYSQGLLDIAGNLLCHTQPLAAWLSSCAGDLLYLDRLQILKPHRGKGLGLEVNGAVMDLFGQLCEVVVIKPFPLQWEGIWDTTADVANEQAAADFAKLTNYYLQLGFSRRCHTAGLYWRTLPVERKWPFDCHTGWRKVKKQAHWAKEAALSKSEFEGKQYEHVNH